MAKTGNYSAYQQVKPISSDVTANMWKANDDAKANQEKKALEQKEEQAEKEKFANELGTSMSKIKAKAIGMQSVDHMIADVVVKARERMHQAYLAKKKDPTDVDAIMTIKNLENLASDIAIYTDTYSRHIADVSKGVQDGRYSPKLNLANLEKTNRTIGQNNGYFELGKDGRLVGVMVDPDGDGVVDFKPMGKVLDGSALDQPIPAADYFGSQKAIKGNYVTHEETMQDPEDQYKSVLKVDLRQEDKDAIMDDAKSLWGTAEEPTDFAKGIIADRLNKNPYDIDKVVFDKYVTDYGGEIINSYQTKHSEKYNFAGRAGDGRLREAKKQNAKGKEAESEANAFRTQIDGALAGSDKYVQNLVGINLDGVKDGVKITEAEFTNGKLLLKLSNGKIRELDAAGDPEKAKGELMGIVRSKDNADSRPELYAKGTPTEKFEKPEAGELKKSALKLKAMVPKLLGQGTTEALKNLELLKITGFTSNKAWWSNEIKSPEGDVFDLDSEADMKLLTKYAIEQGSKKEGTEEEKAEGEEKKAEEKKAATTTTSKKGRAASKSKENEEKAEKAKAKHVAAKKEKEDDNQYGT